jgi:hypothetical protein
MPLSSIGCQGGGRPQKIFYLIQYAKMAVVDKEGSGGGVEGDGVGNGQGEAVSGDVEVT